MTPFDADPPSDRSPEKPRSREDRRSGVVLTDGQPRLLISRSALLHNAAVLRNRLEEGVKLCAVIKADAYGHGAGIVGDTLRNFSLDGSGASAVDQLAVATIEEAAALPDFECPLTILRPVENVYLGRNREMIELAVRNDWTLTLTHPAAADDVARIAARHGLLARVQVMVDTGMTRCGCPPDVLGRLLERLATHPTLHLTGLGTHFVNAEVRADEFTAEQLRRFVSLSDEPIARYGGRVIRHAANSASVLLSPRTHFDMVRPGLALYGVDPTGRPSVDRPLRPAMTWVAPLLSVHEVSAGTSVGYGRTWVASRATRVGLVPVGYADGYPRSLSNRGVMRVHGHDCPVIGRVSMDLTTIDVTDAPHATIGEGVTVLDADPLSAASVYALARAADTIPYEILSRIGPRVLRVAVDPHDAEIASADEPDEDS